MLAGCSAIAIVLLRVSFVHFISPHRARVTSSIHREELGSESAAVA